MPLNAASLPSTNVYVRMQIFECVDLFFFFYAVLGEKGGGFGFEGGILGGFRIGNPNLRYMSVNRFAFAKRKLYFLVQLLCSP